MVNRNSEAYKEEEKVYRQQLAKYKTLEEKIDYLERCDWQIQMIDHWTDRDWICNDIVHKFLKELKGVDKE